MRLHRWVRQVAAAGAVALVAGTLAGSLGAVTSVVTSSPVGAVTNDVALPPVPTVTGVNPNFGPTAGGTSVTLAGTNLTGTTAVDFGTNAATGVTCGDTSCTATAPAGPTNAVVGNTVDVTVTGPGGTSTTSPADQYTYTVALSGYTIGISASSASASVGQSVVLTATSSPDVGPSPGGLSIVDATTATVVAHERSGTSLNFTATQTSAVTQRYVAEIDNRGGVPVYAVSAPVFVTWFTPPTLTTSGTPTTLTTGAAPVPFTATLYNSVPDAVDHPSSRYDFTVTGPSGFVYSDLDLFYETTPGSGTYTQFGPPELSNGATPGTVEGYYGPSSGFDIPAGFDATTNFKIAMGASAPLGTYQAVISLDTVNGSGQVTGTVVRATPITFDVGAVPTVTGVSPSNGSPAGGTSVAVTGTNLSGATAVGFGSTAASTFDCTTDTSCTATSPSGSAGTVDVTVTTPFGTSASSSADQFTYALTPLAGGGYWVVGSDGTVYPFGGVLSYGSLPALGVHVNNIVGMAATPDNGGYWLVGSDGAVFVFGDAGSFGSLPSLGIHVNDIVGIASTSDGGGYWLVGSDGGVFSFGDATFYGSMGGHHLNQPVVGMATTTSAISGNGYWLVASDGGVFAFGGATFQGSMGGQHLNQPVVGIASPGNGYWLVATDGGIFSFGSAQFRGSMGGSPLNRPVNGMASTASGNGYWLVASDGGIFSFGDATFGGSVPGLGVHVDNIVGIAGRHREMIGIRP